MATIQYQPLDRSKRDFRLIVLSDAEDLKSGSGAANESLKCALITTSLDLYKEPLRGYATYGANLFRNALARKFLKDQPYSREFYGLSYVWGDPAAVCDIEIDSKAVKIGANLHAALTSIRRNTDFRVIWVDGLCINQADNIEKSWQVQQMAAIFSRAQATISWLGPPSRDSSLALETLSNLNKKTSRFFWSIQEAKEGGPPPNSVKKNVLSIVENSRIWDAIVDLCSRPYWSRIWIFQEMACASKKYFLCGNTLVEDIDRSISLLLAWQATGREAQGKLLGAHCLSMIDAVQTFRFHGNFPSDAPYYIRPGTLHDMLTMLSGLNATNQRDLIYAPLGIATDKNELNLVPDYSKEPDTIFNETTCALLRAGQLKVLLSASFRHTNRQLPSWVPDWSLLDPAPPYILYRADDGRSQRPEVLQSIPGYSEKVSLDGYVIGRITAMCDVCPASALGPAGVMSTSTETFSSWLRRVEIALTPSGGHTSDVGGSVKDNPYGAAIAELLLPSRSPKPKWSLLADPYIPLYNALKRTTSLGSLIAELTIGAPGKQNTDLIGAVKEVQENLKTGSRPYRLDSGLSGLTWGTKDNEGDSVVVIPGVCMPLVLRQHNQGSASNVAQTGTTCYAIVGPTYVPGIMFGEFVKKKGSSDVTTFTLI